MRRATPAGLERISDLRAKLRGVNGLLERGPGVFYRRSRAFLHFHEDPTGMFADVRLAGDNFVRLRVTSRAEQASLLVQVRRAVGEEPLARRCAAVVTRVREARRFRPDLNGHSASEAVGYVRRGAVS